MSRVVYEDDVIKLLNRGLRSGMYPLACDVRALQSAQPERKTGHWIKWGNRVKCDQCALTNRYSKPFCPNCGADMRGKKDE